MSAPLAGSNSSPLIGLERIGQLDLLERLFSTVSIPSAVLKELGPHTILPTWCVHSPLQHAIPRSLLVAHLGAGETEAIALAIELGPVEVLLDDKQARALAQANGLRVVGVIGLLLRAKKGGLLPVVKPLLDLLVQTQFHISRQPYEHALRLAGEQP
jgi:hypothetical protein